MTRIAIPALALVAALGLAACEKASTATPASQARPATTTTVEATTTTASEFAGVTARSGGDRLFAEYLESEGNSIDYDVARRTALATCDLLDDGTDPVTVVIAGARAAMDNGLDAKDAGQVMGAGVAVYCPEHSVEFLAASEAVEAATR